jgi:acyl-CoA thioesterase-1
VLAVAVFSASCSAPPTADPDIQKKADAFSDEVSSDLQAKEVAAAEARLIRLKYPKNRPLNVFYAGDSLGFGFHASVQAKAYRPLVTAKLEETVPVEEYRATKPASAPLFQIGNIQGIPTSGIDLAIIELGTNDAGRTDIPDFRRQYDAVLTKVMKGSPSAYILCAGAWGFPGTQGTDPYDRVIEEVCREHGGRYIDLTEAFMTKGSYGPEGKDTWVGKSDNFHPNDKGHRIIADLILERIILVQ